jgi:hypothetical protein
MSGNLGRSGFVPGRSNQTNYAQAVGRTEGLTHITPPGRHRRWEPAKCSKMHAGLLQLLSRLYKVSRKAMSCATSPAESPLYPRVIPDA